MIGNPLNISLRSLLIASICPTSLLVACSSSSEPETTTVASPTQPARSTVTINLSANNIAFDKTTMAVPANSEVTVVLVNKDRASHNLSVYAPNNATNTIFIGEIISGPRTITYQFTAPSEPRTYLFRCDVHPNIMKGSFIAT